MAESTSGTPSETTREPDPNVARWRRILCAVLVVLVCILAPLSLLAVWTRNTLLNTDQYVETIGPLAGNADVQQAISDRIVLALTENADLEQKVAEALPTKAAFVAPFVAQGIERFVGEATLRILESDRFQKLWEQANRRAHGQVVAVLTGNEGGRITTKDGEVVINLGPVVKTVRAKISELGIDVFSGDSGRRVSNQFVLFKAEDLTKIQGVVDLLDQIAIVLPILMLLMLGAAIALSGNRRRTVLRAAIGIAIGMALILAIFNVLKRPYLDAFRNRDAAEAAYDQVLEFLRLSAQTALAVAIVVAIGAWLAGPGNLATRIREGVQRLVSGEAGKGIEQTPVGQFVARYKTALRAVVIGIGLIILAILSAPTPLAVLVIVVLVVIGLLLLEFLARGSTPDETASTTENATKRSP